ncbi:MAG: hypothetical protein HY288_18080 [Planctomycetia bacterium]|nr:hypothetical protein [Planctomycetia bacterium]
MLRWKRALALVAGVVAIGWLVAGFLRRDDSCYSPGKLAWAHATLEQDCAACHVDFSPIRGDAWLARALSTTNVVDQQCKRCHPVGDHHPNQVRTETSCASCHLEHQGRDALLTRTTDRSCTECHADLKGHSKGPTNFEDVSRFDREHHPEFKSIATDPGRLKFSHRRHLARGLTFGPLDRPDAWTLDKIPASFQKQYQGFAEESQLLKLDCSACHRSGVRERAPTAQGESRPEAVSARSSGDYMGPIIYEAHCQACHPLNFKPPSETLNEPDSSDLIPHRLTSKQIGQFLERAYSALVFKQETSLWDEVISPPRNLPHKPVAEHEVTMRRQLEQGISDASSRLRVVCSKCHGFAQPQTHANQLPEIAAVNVPQMWLKHARFDHAPHKATALACRDCHAGASLDDEPPAWTKDLRNSRPIDATATLDNSEVLIPGIEKCLDCHGPSVTNDDRDRGGARFDCVECHWYHPDRDALSEAAAGGDRRFDKNRCLLERAGRATSLAKRASG